MGLRHQLERQGKSAFACLMLPGMLILALQGKASLIQGIEDMIEWCLLFGPIIELSVDF